MRVEFWFEFGSTYSYPAAMRIEALAAKRGLAIAWRPFLLGPIFGEQGWNDSPFNLYPVKGRYMWRDLERICEAQGLPFRRPSRFPRNGLLAARVACRFAEAPWLPEFVRFVYRANFEEDRDIGAPETVSGCLAAAGADPAPAFRDALSDESKAALRVQTAEAARLGIFGAPTVVADRELFWGNDRLEDALAWAAQPGILRSRKSETESR
jgi:2-hydroxychromene-2-carboxylate isomerase